MWFVVRKNLKDSLKEKWFVEEVERLDWNSVWGQHMFEVREFFVMALNGGNRDFSKTGIFRVF